jgi:hypothetical protein
MFLGNFKTDLFPKNKLLLLNPVNLLIRLNQNPSISRKLHLEFFTASSSNQTLKETLVFSSGDRFPDHATVAFGSVKTGASGVTSNVNGSP